MSSEEFSTLVLEARSEAINQALADGVVTQEKADWMLSCMDQFQLSSFGPGFGPCHGYSASLKDTFHGSGWRWNNQPTP